MLPLLLIKKLWLVVVVAIAVFVIFDFTQHKFAKSKLLARYQVPSVSRCGEGAVAGKPIFSLSPSLSGINYKIEDAKGNLNSGKISYFGKIDEQSSVPLKCFAQ